MKRVRVELEDADGYVYVLPSLVYAREYLGISRAQMKEVCDKGIRVLGYLVRKSEEKDTNERELPRMKGTEHRRVREEVVAWREGEAIKFPSVADAARVAGCREVTIRQALRREAKAGGWYWEKAEEFEREYKDWCPGMPVVFKFRANAMVGGRPVEKKDNGDSGTVEQQEWKRVKARTAQEWRDYLNKCLWDNEFTPPLADIKEDEYGIF